jgi:excisionase family DNA binding protein
MRKRKVYKNEDTMLSASEVALLLGVHINTIRRWSNKGALRSYRIGPRGDRRFKQEDIGDLLEARDGGRNGKTDSVKKTEEVPEKRQTSCH